MGPYFVLLLIALLAYLLYPYRYRIQTRVWHWRNGDTVTVGGYRFPVGRDWLPRIGSQDDVRMMNTRSGESIQIIVPLKATSVDPGHWRDVIKQHPIADLTVTGEHELIFAGEPMICLEQEYNLKRSVVRNVDCRATGQIEVMYVSLPNSEFEEFYSILASVQKAR
jgi:hypothetical protein